MIAFPGRVRLAAGNRPVAAQELVETLAGPRQLTRLARLVVAHAVLFEVGVAGLGINDSHGRQDMLLSSLPQGAKSRALRHALRSTSGRATHHCPAVRSVYDS